MTYEIGIVMSSDPRTFRKVKFCLQSFPAQLFHIEIIDIPTLLFDLTSRLNKINKFHLDKLRHIRLYLELKQVLRQVLYYMDILTQYSFNDVNI